MQTSRPRYEEKLQAVKPAKNLGTTRSVLLLHVLERTCCQKLLLGFFSCLLPSVFHSCVSYSLRSVLTLTSLSPSSTPQTKPQQSLLPEGHHLWFCFWHHPVHFFFALVPPPFASWYGEFHGCLQTPSPQDRGCLAMVGNVQPS